jgi:glycosyltransferase involved in cell wall biosynthesis
VLLTIAGGDELAPWKARVAQLGVGDRVRFVGWVDQPEAARQIAASDVLALPSYDEGLPLVILEALGHGVPVLCTPVGEIPQFLVDREHALFVQPGAPQEIADRLAELVRDPALAAHLSSTGQALFDQKFSLEAFTASLVAIYRERCGLVLPPAAATAPLAERTTP